jgi:hypothetical protein
VCGLERRRFVTLEHVEGLLGDMSLFVVVALDR